MTKKIITVKCRKTCQRVHVADFKEIHYKIVKKYPDIPKFNILD
jgi:hypothetical protein